jgi:deoxyadenosine/deoxycytidine kinase
MRIVSLEGNIGSGKSSVLAALDRDYDTRPEPVAQWAPWLAEFYAKADGAALGLQLQVLASFHDVTVGASKLVVVERSPQTGKDIFLALLVERGVLAAHELALYRQLYAQLAWTPTERVYLRCTPELALKRVQARNRDHEEAVDLAYLTELHRKHEELYADSAHVIDASQSPEAVAAELRQYLL